MEYLMLILVTCMTLGSQLALKKGITMIGPLLQTGKIAFFSAAITSPYVITAVLMQGVGFILWIFVLSKMKLGIAFGLSGSFFYLLMAFSSWYLYGERLSLPQWVGLVFISAGVLLMTWPKS